jgi:large subunit ribosomal protein L21
MDHYLFDPARRPAERPLKWPASFRACACQWIATMYAIIEDSGCQFKVEEGQEVRIDLREQEIEPGSEIRFERVLAVRDPSGLRLGKPLLADASVTAEVLGEVHGPKLVIQKFRRRKNFRRKTGHRQPYLTVKITRIQA